MGVAKARAGEFLILQDSNDDGFGDLRGLISRLDYLEWLGIDCIWLLPIYPSPLRDDGYDISDYMSCIPSTAPSTISSTFIDEAHTRGIRVITELVMNHTSDQHPWFQASRARRPTARTARLLRLERHRRQVFRGARIIFLDTEQSNWTWDPVAQAVLLAPVLLPPARPELRQPAGSSDEMLQVHALLARPRRRRLPARRRALPVRARGHQLREPARDARVLQADQRRRSTQLYPDRVLLAEANQWPADVRPTSASGGDECHMAFHFPLMPRIFMAAAPARTATRSSTSWPQTPAIPANCQWGIFLRNHDELTLEMVTDAERDYMYVEYAPDPADARQHRASGAGWPRCWRTTARSIELLNALLLSLPGTPVLYYGDEIGMGDNI